MRCPGIHKVPPHVWKLLGPPPLFAIDTQEHYCRTMAAIAAVVKPLNDILVWFSIKDAVDARFEVAFYTRIKADRINEAEADQRKARMNAREDMMMRQIGELIQEEDAEKKRALKSAKEVEKSNAEIDEILAAIAAAWQRRFDALDERDRFIIERDYTNPTLNSVVAAWKGWIFPLLKIDELLTAAHRRYDKARDELERHRMRHFIWTEPMRTASASRRSTRRLPLAQASAGAGQRRRARNGGVEGRR